MNLRFQLQKGRKILGIIVACWKTLKEKKKIIKNILLSDTIQAWIFIGALCG